MIPTPAKRRHFEPHKQQVAPEGGGSGGDDDDDDDGAEEEEEEGAATGGADNKEDEQSEAANVNKRRESQFDRLPLAEQRLLLCQQQQQLHNDMVVADDEEHARLQLQQQQRQEDQVDEMFDEDDELDYLGLDTIVEEDESLEQADEAGDSHANRANRSTPGPPQLALSQPDNNRPDSSRELQNPPSRPPVERAPFASLSNGLDQQQNLSLISETTTATTNTTNELNSISMQEQQATGNNQCDTASKPGGTTSKQRPGAKAHQHHHQQGPLLPSTNRLISEHQARQQQTTLFKALAERQKLLDELGPAERQQVDLLSTNSTGSLISLRRSSRQATTGAKSGQQRRARSTSRTRVGTEDASGQRPGDRPTRARSRSRRRRSLSRHRDEPAAAQNDDDEAIPLSAVDFSSMSDRMLEDLLGHIASASSSSSLSSSSDGNESLGSSMASSASVSCSSACASSSESELAGDGPQQGRRSHRRHHRQHHQHTPSVVGVHEDTEAIGRGNRHRLAATDRSCRDAHRKSRRRNTDGDDDDFDPSNGNDDNHHRQGDQMLAVSVGGGQAHSASSLSPLTSGGGGGGNQKNNSNGSIDQLQRLRRPSSRIATSPAPLVVTNGADHEQGPKLPAQRQDQSVEAVLGRMLEALNEIGVSDEQEQLNDLLERGFLHLEQLLNCSLAPGAPTVASNDGSQVQHQQQQQQQPLKSSPISLVHSQNANLNSTTTILSKDSDYGSDTQSADCFNCSPASDQQAAPAPTDSSSGAALAGQQARASLLSPLAIELSFRLAESLRRLSQRQQQHHQQASDTSQPGLAGAQSDSMTTTSPVSDDRQEVAPTARAAPKQQANSDSDSGSQTTTRSASGKRTPMKSIVMINSASPAAETPLPPLQQQLQVSGACSRNPTPVEQPQQQQQQQSSRPQSRQSYKTLVNLNAAGGQDVSSVRIEASDEPEPELNEQQAAQQHHRHANEINTIQIQSAGKPSSSFVRRRSSRRSSLRRRPSFGSGQPRPGSPVPLAALEVPASGRLPTSKVQQDASDTMGAQEDLKQQQQQQQPLAGNQLRRALVLAQKYNYSPAKLAASKLGAKLQLNQLANGQTGGQGNHSPGPNGATGATTEFEAADSSAGHPAPQAPQQQHDPTTTTTAPRKSTASGHIQLDISYLAESGSLTVHILRCRQLAAASKRKATSNPYVKAYLLPDKSKHGKRKSATKRNELNPQFDERFTFGPVQWADFERRALWLGVWHKDRLGKRNELLGELLLPLAQVRLQLFQSDLCHSTAARWYPLSLERLAGAQTTTTSEQTAAAKPNRDQRGPLGAGCTSVMLAPSYETAPRAQQRHAAEQVRRKLNEFERRAAQLTSQTGGLRLAADSALAEAGARSTRLPHARLAGGESQAAPPVASRHHPPEAMEVTLGGQPGAPAAAAAAAAALASNGLAQNPITGQLFVALKFVPENVGEPLARRSAQMEGELRVLIKEARQVGGASATAGDGQPLAAKHLPSPYCKCYLLDSRGQRVAKQRTSQLRRTSNPRWDQECAFTQLKLANLPAQAVEILLFNRDSILVSASECLGGIRLCKRRASGATGGHADTVSLASSNQSEGRAECNGNGAADPATATLRSNRSSEQADGELGDEICSEKEAKLWTQMLARPNIWVYGELPLRRLRPLVPAAPTTGNPAAS